MAIGPTKYYDPDQVAVYFGGALLQGFADGSFVEVSNSSDAFASVVGTDGEVARSKTNNRMGRIKFKLLQTSSSNSFLSGVHNTDLNAPNGAGVSAVQIQDLSGFSLASGAEAWIVKYPDADYDRSAKSREWEIEVANLIRFEGGNLSKVT